MYVLKNILPSLKCKIYSWHIVAKLFGMRDSKRVNQLNEAFALHTRRIVSNENKQHKTCNIRKPTRSLAGKREREIWQREEPARSPPARGTHRQQQIRVHCT